MYAMRFGYSRLCPCLTRPSQSATVEGVDALVVVSTFSAPIADPALAFVNAEVAAARAFDAAYVLAVG